MLVGEAGSGKSRMLAAFMDGLTDEFDRLCFFCSPQHQDSPFFPILTQMASMGILDADFMTFGADVDRGEAAAGTPRKGSDLEHTDRATGCGSDHLSTVRMRNAGRHDQVFEAFAGRLAALAARRPLSFCLRTCLERRSTLSCWGAWSCLVRRVHLVLVSSRPGVSPFWADLSHISSRTLNGLSQRDAAILATRTASPAPLSSSVVKRIVARSEGVPLFIEEFTRAVIEADCMMQHPSQMRPISMCLFLPYLPHCMPRSRCGLIGCARCGGDPGRCGDRS